MMFNIVSKQIVYQSRIIKIDNKDLKLLSIRNFWDYRNMSDTIIYDNKLYKPRWKLPFPQPTTMYKSVVLVRHVTADCIFPA